MVGIGLVFILDGVIILIARLGSEESFPNLVLICVTDKINFY